jgi:hypothetical protein
VTRSGERIHHINYSNNYHHHNQYGGFHNSEEEWLILPTLLLNNYHSYIMGWNVMWSNLNPQKTGAEDYASSKSFPTYYSPTFYTTTTQMRPTIISPIGTAHLPVPLITS